MNIFIYDYTFEGLLTCIFDAYFRKTFPDLLFKGRRAVTALFTMKPSTSVLMKEKQCAYGAGWKRKYPTMPCPPSPYCWLSELPEVDKRLFRYIRKAIDSPRSIETNFADADVLELSKIYKKVDGERVHLMQFVRFQKAADGTFFAAVEPQFNALPLAVEHFKDRFADQPWLIYDVKRQYGYYYDLKEMKEVTFENPQQAHLVTGMLNESLMANDEKLFRQLWKTYFKAICIKERWNPRKHRQDMPVRYWKYLTEKQ